MKKRILLISTLLLTLSQGLVAELNHKARGLEIRKLQQETVSTGFNDFFRKSRMVIRDSSGRVNERELSILTLEQDGADKSLVVVDKPRDLKGTAFLTHPKPGGADDQWIYLPGLKRVKRISSKNKSGAFLGSEFTYEDVGLSDYRDYENVYIRDDEVDGKPCYVVEAYPIDEDSGYNKEVYWIEKSTLFNLRIDYYNRRDEFLKTMLIKGWKMYRPSYAVAKDMYVTNHITGNQSELHLWNVRLDSGYKPSDFSVTKLKRAR